MYVITYVQLYLSLYLFTFTYEYTYICIGVIFNVSCAEDLGKVVSELVSAMTDENIAESRNSRIDECA